METVDCSPKSLEQKARRFARCNRLVMRKTRRGISMDNVGGFTLIEPYSNTVVAGQRFELTAQQIIDRFTADC